ETPEAFELERDRKYRYAGQITAWSIEAGNEAGSNRIATSGNNYRHGCGCHPQCAGRNVGSTCKEDRHFALDQFGRQFRESIELAVCPAEFNRNVLAVNVTCFVQRPAERCYQAGIRSKRATTQETDHRRRRLLRAGHQRPHHRRASEKLDELAPPHSITSSARDSSDCGTERPSALAALRLMTSSYFVGARTGRSPGFSPLRMRST